MVPYVSEILQRHLLKIVRGAIKGEMARKDTASTGKLVLTIGKLASLKGEGTRYLEG